MCLVQQQLLAAKARENASEFNHDIYMLRQRGSLEKVLWLAPST